MKNDSHKTIRNDEGKSSVETVDAVARAAHLWIRSLCLTEVTTEEERYATASGLVAGLCERLALTPRIQALVAYVYSLLDNEGSRALAVSRLMLDEPASRSARGAYARGKSEAVGIVELIRYQE
jgi:hypothetical protein